MTKKYIGFLFLLLSGCICFYSCVTPGTSKQPEILADSLLTMPEDASRAVKASVNLLAGNTFPDVRFSPQAVTAITGGMTLEKGFTMNDSQLHQYESINDGTGRRIKAVITFENPIGRRCQSELNLSYYGTGKRILVETGAITPIFGKIPESVCFVVPADALPRSASKIPEKFETLYRKMANKSVVPGDPQIPSEAGDWGMVVFFMDRISPSANVKLCISAVSTGISGYSEASRYMDYNGWRVGITAGRFALMEPDSEEDLFLKAIYTQGEEAGFIKRSLLTGLYELKIKKN